MSEVLYMCPFRLPDEGPAAGRVLANAKAIRAAGFPVRLVGRGNSATHSDETEPAVFEYEGFECHPIELGASARYRGSRIGRFFGVGASAARWLEDRFNQTSVRLVILVGAYGLFGYRVVAACLRRRVPLICEAMEWQDPRFCPGGRFGLHRWEVESSLRWLMQRAGNVIAISSYLEQHFRQRGCQALRVLPLVDLEESRWAGGARASSSESGELRLLFSGTWRRDRQDLILQGMEILRKRGRLVRLEYLGSTREDLASYSCAAHRSLQVLGDAVRFHGCVARDEVPRISASADFAVLLREDARWSRACFPSKTAEFQALGVPMLCNLTSDLGEVLRDGENALMVPEISAAAFAATVERAWSLSPTDKARMREHSLQCAKSKFDYRNYSHRLGEFIGDVSGQAPARRMIGTDIGCSRQP